MRHRFRLSVRLPPSLEAPEYVLTQPKFGDQHFLKPVTVFSDGLLGDILFGGCLLFLVVFSYPSTLSSRQGDLLLAGMELRILYHSQRKRFCTSLWSRDRNLAYF